MATARGIARALQDLGADEAARLIEALDAEVASLRMENQSLRDAANRPSKKELDHWVRVLMAPISALYPYLRCTSNILTRIKGEFDEAGAPSYFVLHLFGDRWSPRRNFGQRCWFAVGDAIPRYGQANGLKLDHTMRLHPHVEEACARRWAETDVPLPMVELLLCRFERFGLHYLRVPSREVFCPGDIVLLYDQHDQQSLFDALTTWNAPGGPSTPELLSELEVLERKGLRLGMRHTLPDYVIAQFKRLRAKDVEQGRLY